MATPVEDRQPGERSGRTGTPSRNARLSQHRRSKRPLPATRHEADEIFAPRARIAPARASRLERLCRLGCLTLVPAGTGHITQGQAHHAILDALYPEDSEAQ